MSLVADDDDGRCFLPAGKGLPVKILPVEEGAVDVAAGTERPAAELRDVLIVETDAEKRAHGSLHDLGVEKVGRVRRCVDAVDAEPVGDADDGAEIAGVADAVEGQVKARTGRRRYPNGVRNMDQRQHRGRCREQGHAFHRLLSHFFAPVDGLNRPAGTLRLSDHLLPLHDK